MKPTVYIETTIIGYLAMRPSKSLQLAAKQEITREWWNNERTKYSLFVSQYVIDECSAGDPTASQERLQFLKDISIVNSSPKIEQLARSLVGGLNLPNRAALDAFHIAAAAVNNIQCLVSWNCTHIANPHLQNEIERLCIDAGVIKPVICTLDELRRLQHDP